MRYLLVSVMFAFLFFQPLLAEDDKMTVDVPQWAKTVVWYQIFPERFHNGDPDNDPTLISIKNSWPHDHTSPWQVHPWTSDWYALQPWEKENGQDIWFNIQRRRYGGDLQGILDKLDYLQDLGVGAIYLNPIFWAPSLHKYDGATYHHVDPYFGPYPEDDIRAIATEVPEDPTTWLWTDADKLFLHLLFEAHSRNIRVIIDGVFNHMGLNSWAFQDVQKNQQDSKYRDWFSIKSWDNPETGNKFDYDGWFGVRELPEIREDEHGIVAGPKQYIFDITKRWMDPNGDGDPEDGIDGWRLDVAFCVKHEFWKDWRKHVKSINPEAYIVAEVIDQIDVVQPYLMGDEFDAVMNYNFAFTCAEYMMEEKSKINTAEFDRRLAELRHSFDPEISYVMQNLFGSHDSNRLGSHIVNGKIATFRDWGGYFGISQASNPDYQTRKPTVEELAIQKLFAIFQMTYLGAPMIYYGDEAGMWGGNDPCCRKPMIWPELRHEAEVFNPDGTKKDSPDSVMFNVDLHTHYRQLIHIRNQHPALQMGDFQTMVTADDPEIYIFSRRYESEEIIVVLNNSDLAQSYQLMIDGEERFKDLLNGGQIESQQHVLTLQVPAKWGMILLRMP